MIIFLYFVVTIKGFDTPNVKLILRNLLIVQFKYNIRIHNLYRLNGIYIYIYIILRNSNGLILLS